MKLYQIYIRIHYKTYLSRTSPFRTTDTMGLNLHYGNNPMQTDGAARPLFRRTMMVIPLPLKLASFHNDVALRSSLVPSYSTFFIFRCPSYFALAVVHHLSSGWLFICVCWPFCEASFVSHQQHTFFDPLRAGALKCPNNPLLWTEYKIRFLPARKMDSHTPTVPTV